MQSFNPQDLKKLYIPAAATHKGQNGKLMVIGGSHLFHAASLWALTVASRIVDMVFYSSVPENNKIVYELKKEFRNGIIVPRETVEEYIAESDAILIGPGMVRTGEVEPESQDLRSKVLQEITALADEGEQSYYLTRYLLERYPEKKWVIDAGALQMLDPEWLLPLGGHVILTPHPKELERLIRKDTKEESSQKQQEISDKNALLSVISRFSQKYNCTILLKGQEDMICSPKQCLSVSGGNAGMTKGGTGDVLAGLVAALSCNNDVSLAGACGSYINKQAGNRLFERMGYYFNASDLAEEVPLVMRDLILR